jgi:endonuclease YncB( thermonuclease family)
MVGNRPRYTALAGIDAPERDRPFGQRSRQSLSELAFGKTAARSEPEVFAGRGGAKRTCGEMTSGEEAQFYLTAIVE